MLNNDIFRRIRYILDFNDKKIIDIFDLMDQKVSITQVVQWLKKEDDLDFNKCVDVDLASFLNGLIIERRGKRDGIQPNLEKKLTNNIIFKKLIIAFNLKSNEVLEILYLADFRVSKHELSAFFRKQNHRSYRECKTQILRNFLTGLQLKYRGKF